MYIVFLEKYQLKIITQVESHYPYGWLLTNDLVYYFYNLFKRWEKLNTIFYFFIHGSLLAVEVINDCQYQENNILDLHFVIEHPIIGTDTLINISCSVKTQSIHCSGIQLNLNMLMNITLQDGLIKHMKDIKTIFKK